jgi:hypothetical protein
MQNHPQHEMVRLYTTYDIDDNDLYEPNIPFKKQFKASHPDSLYAVISENLASNRKQLSFKKWKNYLKLYLSIEILIISINYISSISFFILSLWLTLNTKNLFLSNLANQTKYTTLNKFNIGYLNYLCLVISIVALCVDGLYTYLFFKVKKFLLEYPKKYDKSMEQVLPIVAFRKRIRTFVTYVKLLVYIYNFIYILVVILLKLFIGIWLRVNLGNF